MLMGCADSYHWTASHPSYHKAPYGGIAVTGIENAFVITRSNWFAKRLEISTDSIQIKGTEHCRKTFETELRKAYGNLIVLPDTANSKFPEESLKLDERIFIKGHIPEQGVTLKDSAGNVPPIVLILHEFIIGTDLKRENFFDYADMKDTYFVGDGKDPCSGYSPAQEKYISDKEDKYRQAEGAYVYLFSAGSVVSTAEDVLRWLRVVSSSEEMYNATDRKIVEHSTWLYNYGWNTGDYIWHHSGRTYAYSSQIYADYKTDTQLVILTNVSFYEPLGELAYRVYYPLVDEVKKAK